MTAKQPTPRLPKKSAAPPPVARDAPVEKHPELRAMFTQLQEEKAAIRAETQPLHDQYDKLAAQIAPLADKQRALAEQFHAIERPRLSEIESQLSALARALGGRRMSEAPPPETT